MNCAGAKIKVGKAGSQRNDSASQLAQSKAADILRHRPRLQRSVCRVEAVNGWLFDIYPVENLVNWAPNGGFAEQSLGRENTTDLRRPIVSHALRIVIDNK